MSINFLHPKLMFERQLQRVDQHRGSSDDYVRRVMSLLGPHRVRNREQRQQLAACAARWCSDDRMLLHAACELQQTGGDAPGVDGIRSTELEREHLIAIARQLHDRIRGGRYQPAPSRPVSIRKSNGGERVLEIPAVQDRIVGKACATILSRFFEPEFDARSYGFRRSRNRLQALAEAVSVSEHEQRTHWIVDDIVAAFEHVPLARLWQILRARLPGGESFVELLRTVIGTQRTRGLPTGHPLSPLLLNIYLDHVLDRWWRKQYPAVPLLRTADDLLILCRSQGEAEQVYPALARRLRDAGLQLHGAEQPQVLDVRHTAAEFLGFQVRWHADDWSIRLSADWRQQIGRRLRRLPAPPDGLAEARQVIEAVIAQCGPVYAQRSEVLDFIAQQLSSRGLEVALEATRLQQLWQAAGMRWQAARQRDQPDNEED